MTGRARLASGLAAVLLAGGLGGCTSVPSVVTVLGPWVGDEEADFRTVLDAAGIPYEYQGSRNVGEVLQAAVRSGNPPDLAVLPTIGDLTDHIAAGKAKPLGGIIGNEQGAYSASWLPHAVLEGVDTRQVYAIPIKAALKSIVWFDRTVTQPPATWATALDRPWCLGLSDPPSSGWPASDWIEDLVLHQDSGAATYGDWVAGRLDWRSPRMVAAWRAFGRVVERSPGGAARALTTQYGDAGLGLSDKHGCGLDHQPSFIRGVQGRYGGDPDRFDFVQFPTVGTDPRSEVSVDVAAMFTSTTAAAAVIAFLAGREAQAIWPAIRGSGAFSVRGDVPPAPGWSEVDRRIGDILAGRGKEVTAFCLDASDLMPAPLRDRFYRGLREYLSEPRRLPEILRRLQEAAEATRPAVVFPVCA